MAREQGALIVTCSERILRHDARATESMDELGLEEGLDDGRHLSKKGARDGCDITIAAWISARRLSWGASLRRRRRYMNSMRVFSMAKGYIGTMPSLRSCFGPCSQRRKSNEGKSDFQHHPPCCQPLWNGLAIPPTTCAGPGITAQLSSSSVWTVICGRRRSQSGPDAWENLRLRCGAEARIACHPSIWS
jgi:hypothetical protein